MKRILLQEAAIMGSAQLAVLAEKMVDEYVLCSCLT